MMTHQPQNYRTILIDPPWNEQGGGKIKRGADRHYPLLKTPDIIRTIYNSGVFNPDKDAHLYLWVTNNFLQDGLEVMKALGFRYITNLVWVKPSFGLGQYFRGQHELLLFGVKGRLASQATPKNIPTLIEAPKNQHSSKPPKTYEYIEKTSPAPRLEMFARIKRHNWDVWGNEEIQKTLE